MNTPNRFVGALALTLLCSAALFAQVAVTPVALPATPGQSVADLPNQAVFGGLQYNQSSSPQSQGFAGYAKLVDASAGVYSYTRFVETSVKLKPQLAIQTQTETGICSVTSAWGGFDIFSPLKSIGFDHVFACATGGIAAAGGSVGASGSGTLLAMKALQKGWTIGIGVSPSYSSVTGRVSYPVGLVIGWGK
jgi:hypothetical protein